MAFVRRSQAEGQTGSSFQLRPLTCTQGIFTPMAAGDGAGELCGDAEVCLTKASTRGTSCVCARACVSESAPPSNELAPCHGIWAQM